MHTIALVFQPARHAPRNLDAHGAVYLDTLYPGRYIILAVLLCISVLPNPK